MSRPIRAGRGNWRPEDFEDPDEIDDVDLLLDIDQDELLPVQKQPVPKSRRRERPRTATHAESVNDVVEEDGEIAETLERKARERRRAGISEPFKCRHCRAFIGMPPTGGQQRNHCPMCLYSLHVDDKTPGDRASDCRSLMQPIGVFYRRNMEQVVVHRCLGCGFARYNRVAADDNPILLGELPVVDLPAAGQSGDDT